MVVAAMARPLVARRPPGGEARVGGVERARARRRRRGGRRARRARWLWRSCARAAWAAVRERRAAALQPCDGHARTRGASARDRRERERERERERVREGRGRGRGTRARRSRREWRRADGEGTGASRARRGLGGGATRRRRVRSASRRPARGDATRGARESERGARSAVAVAAGRRGGHGDARRRRAAAAGGGVGGDGGAADPCACTSTCGEPRREGEARAVARGEGRGALGGRGGGRRRGGHGDARRRRAAAWVAMAAQRFARACAPARRRARRERERERGEARGAGRGARSAVASRWQAGRRGGHGSVAGLGVGASDPRLGARLVATLGAGARGRGRGLGERRRREEEGEVVAVGRVAGRGGRAGRGRADVAAPRLTAACLTTRAGGGRGSVGRTGEGRRGGRACACACVCVVCGSGVCLCWWREGASACAPARWLAVACWRLAVGGVVVGPGWVVRRRAEKWLERPKCPECGRSGRGEGGWGWCFWRRKGGCAGWCGRSWDGLGWVSGGSEHPAIVGYGAHGVRDCEGDGADSEPKGGVSVAASLLAFGAKTTRYGAKWLSVRPA